MTARTLATKETKKAGTKTSVNRRFGETTTSTVQWPAPRTRREHRRRQTQSRRRCASAPSLAALQSAWHTKSTGEDHGENATIVVQGRQEKKQKVEPKLALSNLCAACGAPNPKYRCSRCEVRSWDLVSFCFSLYHYLAQLFFSIDLHWLGDDWEERATDEDFEDDEKCLDYFHRFQTIKKLQEVREEIGYEDFQAVFEHFDSIKNSGYTLEEVIATDTGTLIDREEYLQHHIEEEHDDENSGGDRGDGNDDGETDSWEGVPEEMTRSVLTEEEQMRHAIDASRMSAQEDEVVRRVMKESSGIGD